MSSFRFRLDRVLHLKEKLEKHAELVQAKARFAEQQAADHEAELHGRLAESGPSVGDAAGVAQMAATSRLIEAARHARAQCATLAGLAEQAQRARVEVAVEVTAMQTMRERAHDMHRLRRSRAERERAAELRPETDTDGAES